MHKKRHMANEITVSSARPTLVNSVSNARI